eukprot:370068_1
MNSFLTCMVAIALYIKASPLPPPQDQCKPVSAKEPNECPQTIGPPCPPCYTNEYEDYKSGDTINFSGSEQQEMAQFMDWYLSWWNSHYPPPVTSNGYGIWEGSAGRANIFLRLYQYNKHNSSLIQTASNYVDHAISILPRKQEYTSWANGFNGVYSVKAIIEYINGNNNEMKQYINLLKDSFNDINAAIKNNDSVTPKYHMDMTHLSLNSGLTGALYNALLLNKYFNQSIIDVHIIVNMTYFLLDRGIQIGVSRKHNYLEYLHPYITNCYTFGAGSGSSGVIKMIYEAYNMYPNELSEVFNTNGKYYQVMKNTIDFYVSIQLEDDNMPTQTGDGCSKMYGTDNDARVQWCHGAPAFINVFVQSAILFNKYNVSAAQKYFNSGLRCSNSTWDRGLLVKGTMYCHGIGGNVYMFWELYELINVMKEMNINFNGYDLNFLQNQSAYRAKQFVLWTLNWNNINKTRIYDSDDAFSQHQGNFGIPMLYVQTLQNGWPQTQKVCTPSWNLCF